jgi:Raf kinase inhibitor-like YbhB/YbcL family protein
MIPRLFTCDGLDISPPVHWSKVPSGTTSLSLVMIDQDAHNFVHWTVRGIPSSSTGLTAGHVPAGVSEGANGFGKTGYGGPCPPRGAAHHYLITVTAQRNGRPAVGGTLTGAYVRR